MIVIIIPGKPLPWKAPYVGTRGAYSPRWQEVKIFRQIISEQYHGEIIEYPIQVSLSFYMPIPKATSKKKRLKMISGEIRPAGPPDRSNMAKLYEDCLQGIVIKNDSQIVEGSISKWYDEEPRTVIRILKTQTSEV